MRCSSQSSPTRLSLTSNRVPRCPTDAPYHPRKMVSVHRQVEATASSLTKFDYIVHGDFAALCSHASSGKPYRIKYEAFAKL
jgi:hypothetical protein